MPPAKKKAPAKKPANSKPSGQRKDVAALHARIDKIVHNLTKVLGIDVEGVQ